VGNRKRKRFHIPITGSSGGKDKNGKRGESGSGMNRYWGVDAMMSVRLSAAIPSQNTIRLDNDLLVFNRTSAKILTVWWSR